MFEELVADAMSLEGAAAIRGWARVETAACARRLMAMVVVLDRRHATAGSAEREQWYLDNWSAVCAEIAAAQRITSGAASQQLLVATALRDRLPLVREAFGTGLGSYQLISTIVWRTALIADPEARRAVDAALAAAMRTWEPMSQEKTVAAIDYWVHRFDPHALRRTQSRARSRSVEIGAEDGSGLASLWGSLFSHDAVALDRRLNALAATVCDADPRTVDQRRSDALGALAAGADRLDCTCRQRNCGAAAESGTGSASATVVYVVANEDTVTDEGLATAAEDAALDGGPAGRSGRTPLRELTLAQALVQPTPPRFAVTRPGSVMGGPVLSGPVVRRAVRGAAIRRIVHPGDAPPETRYTPSQRLAEFVRCRDLHCRFPGCAEPAVNCDVDHTIPYPAGPTQASNLKCLCRTHHLLKTFWGGRSGWRDTQFPDGTVQWESPERQRYTTTPGSRLLFPSLSRPTGPVLAAASGRSAASNGLRMPRRTSTRTEDRRRRIDDERELNRSNGKNGHQPRSPASTNRMTATPSSSDASRSTSTSKPQS
jgi:Domain of unknown function (DUF222)